jgi:hypothetical protein
MHENEWIAKGEKLTITFEPYEIIWLTPSSEIKQGIDDQDLGE